MMFISMGISAHHSTFATFDADKIIEIEGTITHVLWRNPHVRFTINTENNFGEKESWVIETDSVSGLRKKNVQSALLKAGDKVKIAGNPSRDGQKEMWVTHILLTSGKELILNTRVKPRWSDQILGRSGSAFAREGDTSEPERGIFRVWTRPSYIPMLFPEVTNPDFDLHSYPLTDLAHAELDAFNAATDNPTINLYCSPKGMPTIMEQPYPLEFVMQGEDIMLRLEEYDIVRTIHMGNEAATEPEYSLLGYSTGHWEGETLVVKTINISWEYFSQLGIRLTNEAEILERFTASNNGARLDYRMIVTDPTIFTEPVELQTYRLYVPGVTVEPFDCIK